MPSTRKPRRRFPAISFARIWLVSSRDHLHPNVLDPISAILVFPSEQTATVQPGGNNVVLTLWMIPKAQASVGQKLEVILERKNVALKVERVLTGMQNLLLMKRVSESLAGQRWQRSEINGIKALHLCRRDPCRP